MSTNPNKTSPPTIGFVVDQSDPGPSGSGSGDAGGQAVAEQPKIKLTWIDKIFRFFYSKEEFEAYLIEKELKRKEKRERKEKRLQYLQQQQQQQLQ